MKNALTDVRHFGLPALSALPRALNGVNSPRESLQRTPG
jgi:hypothetical protein